MGTMPITIGSNIASLQAQRRVGEVTRDLSKSFERLSSGLRINRASDDAAGLSIASSLQADVRIYSQGIRNANDGISALAIAEGSMRELSAIMYRIIELSEQSANGIYGAAQRSALDKEAQALRSEYARIAATTSFNGIALLNSASTEIGIQVGTSSASSSQINVEMSGATYNVGDGTFAATPTAFIGTEVEGIAVGDLNNDGFDDLITWHNSFGDGGIFLGNGNGTFKAEIVAALNTRGNGRGVLADVTGDGSLDWVSPLYDQVSVAIGNGDGTFKHGVQYELVSGGSSLGTDVGDFNGDGAMDIISDDNGVLFISLGNGNGTFKTFTSYTGISSGWQAVAGDVNNDGRLDAVMSNGDVFLGNGNGTFRLGQALFNPAYRSPHLVDLNSDGNLDLIGADAFSSAGVLLGNGDGTFRIQTDYETGDQDFNQYVLDVGDFNGDGAPDMVVTAGGDSALSVLLNNGDGTFKARTSYTTTVSTAGVAVGDLNGDGVLDIAAAEYDGSETINIFYANATTQAGMAAFSLTTASGARAALTAARQTLSELSASIGTIGAAQSRLEVAIANSSISHLNSESAASRIIDIDVATESAESVKRTILQQAAASVLSLANQQPEIVLGLLR